MGAGQMLAAMKGQLALRGLVPLTSDLALQLLRKKICMQDCLL
jgi:hypothetical protein